LAGGDYVGNLRLVASGDMMDYSSKKIAVLGLGIEGEDVCKFLLKHGAKKITIFDQKNPVELGDVYQKFKKKNVEFRLGKNYLDGFSAKDRPASGWDIIFRSPAFKLSLPELVEAKKKGVIVSSATKLFFDICPAKIIGVTGTKGKGTTSTLLYEILKKTGKEVFLAGNIGESMLSLLPQLTKDSWVILELSSFQLQDLEKSPHIAVVLFIASEHLDYHQSVQEYIQAKSNLVSHQLKTDFAVFNADDPVSSSFAHKTPAKKYFFSTQKEVEGGYVEDGTIFLFGKSLGKTSELKIRGEHNWNNVCAASVVGYLAGADIASIKDIVFSFPGLEHRLELVDEIGGVKYYDDSFSTNPETAIAALRSFSEPIVLIAGGSEKGSDYSLLGKEIAVSSVKCLIVIGDMANRIKKAAELYGYRGKIVFQPKNMSEIPSIF